MNDKPNINVYEQAELMTTARRITGRDDLIAVSRPWPEALLGYGDTPGSHYEIKDRAGNILLDLFQRWGKDGNAPKYSAAADKWAWRWQALIGHWTKARNTTQEHENWQSALQEAGAILSIRDTAVANRA